MIQLDFLKQQIIESRSFVNRLMSGFLHDLWYEIEPIPFKRPMAETKYEALSWRFKHEIWHSAEMEAIKVALKHPIVWME